MPAPASRTKLLTLVDREFRSIIAQPPPLPVSARFKARRINLTKFDTAWERKRAAAARLAGILLSHDDAGLTEKVCESADSAKTYASGVDLLRREGAYLRKVAALLDLAGGRLSAVLERCGRPENSAAP
jgi:hypothetical protein